jgi:hypothetical protein
MEAGQVRPTLSEWQELPNTVRELAPLVRSWASAISQEEGKRQSEWEGRSLFS